MRIYTGHEIKAVFPRAGKLKKGDVFFVKSMSKTKTEVNGDVIEIANSQIFNMRSGKSGFIILPPEMEPWFEDHTIEV